MTTYRLLELLVLDRFQYYLNKCDDEEYKEVESEYDLEKMHNHSVELMNDLLKPYVRTKSVTTN